MWWHRKRRECESEQAILEARQNLEKIEERTPEVEEIKTASRKLLEQNGFRKQLEEIMGRAH